MSLLSPGPTGRSAQVVGGPGRLADRTFHFLVVVVAVQGTHVIEHIVQLGQVYIWDVPEDDALGLLGYVFEFNGTEEWLHLTYNALYLAALYALVGPLWRITPATLPNYAFIAFVASTLVETWHLVEHVVIISHVIANQGCPCPGIGDAALGISDVVLHFCYNLVAYAGVVLAFFIILRRRRAGRRHPSDSAHDGAA
jgi:hypothetical protein